MAIFNEAFKLTIKHEGLYSNDVTDMGGETYKGISRKYNSNWSGWFIIDSYKDKKTFPFILDKDIKLNSLVNDFYKVNYWDILMLDRCSSQLIANELFDTSINIGIDRASKFLQIALNVLNKNGSIYKDITVDGKIGNNTINALNLCLDYRGDEFLFKVLNILQGNHYIDLMLHRPEQEKFAYGWLSRVQFIKK